MNLKSHLGRFRDSAARRLLNLKIKSYGIMTALKIDRENKTVSLELELKGEVQPIKITVSNYNIVENDKGTFIEVGEITTSREWMNALLAEPAMKEKIKKFLADPLPCCLKIILRSIL